MFKADKFVPVLLIVTVILSFLVGVLWQKVNNLDKVADSTDSVQVNEQEKISMDQIRGLFDENIVKFGDKDSKLVFVEVSDPSCPYCSIAAGHNPDLNSQAGEQFKLVADGGTYVSPVVEMKKLLDEGKASFVWLYLNGHGNGEMGAKAMYCAYDVNKFWEVHDLLMSSEGYDLLNNTVKNDSTQAKTLADFLGTAVDSSQMQACLESGKYDDRLATDMALGQGLGVGGTPGFFVNETNFAGAYSFTDMQSVVDSILK